MANMPKPLGWHMLLEFYDCDSEYLNSVDDMEVALVDAAKQAGATVVETVFHRFAKQGVSGVVVIAESHVTIHTWPEHGYAAIDAFTCGDEQMPYRIESYLKEKFNAGRTESKMIERGNVSMETPKVASL